MGAYLSEPVIQKNSLDEKSEEHKISYGTSSMQGWRVSQEDAHNCILNYDTNTSFFAVYDGHGGHEVAAYCAEHLPKFLLDSEIYKSGDLGKALEEAYIGFDNVLTKEEVISELKAIAGDKKKDDPPSEDDPDEMSHLYEEATISIEELIMRYSRKIRGKVSLPSDGNSKTPSSLECVLSKLVTRGKRCKAQTEESNLLEKQLRKHTPKEPSADAGSLEIESKNATAENISPEKTDAISDDTNSPNGKVSNGTRNHHSNTKELSTSAKGKGVGKGLSNTIRKVLEKSDEEIEFERKQAERSAKRLERKKSLRAKSADELYKAIATVEEEDSLDEDADDEEDEDFDAPSSEDEVANGDEDDDEEEDDDDEDEDTEEGEDEEQEDPEVAAKAKLFSLGLKEEPGSDSGCTAVVALLRGNTLFVANAGDSRCVLSRQGLAIPLSEDHKPEDEPEKSRILLAGGVVTADYRVNGGLNLSRAFGDHAYKQNTQLSAREQMITALPDIQTINLEPGDDFFVLACDGIFNSKSNQEVIDFVRARLPTAKSLSQICEELFDECLSPNTFGDGTGCDNMTAIIVRLDRFLLDSQVKDNNSLKRSLSEDNQINEDKKQTETENETGERIKRQRIDTDVAEPKE